jgi:SAM-dependent methyltransferase
MAPENEGGTLAAPRPRARALIETAADLAAVTALLEVAEELGIFGELERGAVITAADLAAVAGTPVDGMAVFVKALAAAGLVTDAGRPGSVRVTEDFATLRTAAGYLSWALKANRPFIENPLAFLRDSGAAAGTYRRDSRAVAVSSRWVGLREFYPATLSVMIDARPSRIADLGAGAAGLLIDALGALPTATGVALDISAAACAVAADAAARAGVADRLRVVQASIESIADDPGPVAGADVIHSGFAFHDLAADAETFGAVLRGCREALAPEGFLLVTDAVPYSPDGRERMFSSLFSYLHEAFMNVRLPAEEEWCESFRAAGFKSVRSCPHRMPGARLFIAAT